MYDKTTCCWFSMRGEPWRRSGAIHFCDATLGLWSICGVRGLINANSPKLTKNITDSRHILKGFVSARWERSQKSLATWATLECAGVMDSRQALRSVQKGAKGLLDYAWWIQMLECHFFQGAGGVLVLWSAGHFQSAWLQDSTMLTILHARHM